MAPKRFLVVRDTAPAGALRGAVLAIGNFDGVHRGHRAVIAAARDRAKSLRQAGRGADLRAASARLLQARREAVPADRRGRQIAAAGCDRARWGDRADLQCRAGEPHGGGFRYSYSGRAVRRQRRASSASISTSARIARARPTFSPHRAASTALRSTWLLPSSSTGARSPRARSATHSTAGAPRRCGDASRLSLVRVR